MSTHTELAWYVHALHPAGRALPHLWDAPAGTCVHPTALVTERGVSASVALVPRRWFATSADDRSPEGAANPDWVASWAAGQHGLAMGLHAAGPSLPLGFGTMFGSEAALRAWLCQVAGRADAGLRAVRGRDEWVLRLSVQEDRLRAAVEASDPDLLAAEAAIAAAAPGTAYLLRKRQSRAVAEAVARSVAKEAAAIAAHAPVQGMGLAAEAPPAGATHAWRHLWPSDRPIGAAWADHQARLAERGITLALNGPWPAYGFARAVLEAGHG